MSVWTIWAIGWPLHDVIADRDVDRREPACRSRNRIDDAAAAADQESPRRATRGIRPTTPQVSAAASARQMTASESNRTAW